MVNANAEAITLLEGMVKGGDVILVKGSRGLKMEEIVSGLVREA
jgi:UDP-N-acetylmuramyl pentapeptide synthase